MEKRLIFGGPARPARSGPGSQVVPVRLSKINKTHAIKLEKDILRKTLYTTLTYWRVRFRKIQNEGEREGERERERERKREREREGERERERVRADHPHQSNTPRAPSDLERIYLS